MQCKFCAPYRKALWDACWDFEGREVDEAALWDQETDCAKEQFDRMVELRETDPADALRLAKEQAGKGSVHAMRSVAWHFHSGTGTKSSFVQAEEYYKHAIAAGSWTALLDYSRLLDRHKHYNLADEMIKQGVDAGYWTALFWQASFQYFRSPTRKIARLVQPQLLIASEAGHPGAKWLLIKLSLFGKLGLKEIPNGFRQAIALHDYVAAKQEPE